MATDPLSNWRRIDVPKRSRYGIIDDLEAQKTGTPCGVEAKHGFGGNANSITRNNTEHMGAGRCR